MSELKELGYGIYLDISQLQQQADKAKKSFKDIGDSAGKQGKSMSDAFGKASGSIGASLGSMIGKFASVTAAIALVTKTIKNLIETNMNFERKSSELAAVLGTTKDGVKELTDAARELGRYTEYTATEVEELQISLARLGFTKTQILDMQSTVLKFAQATGAELGAAANFAGASLRAFGLEAKDSTHLLDVMAASTSKSALDFSKLESSMSTIAPVAHSFGLSVEDTVTFLGALANAGFDASTAATAMRNILLNLADANGNLAKGLGHTANNFPDIIAALKECTEKGIDLNAALEMTDKRSVSAFSALISGADAANELRDALGNCDGTLNQMSDTMTDNLLGAVNSLKSAWEGLMLTMQNSTGILSKAVSGLARGINILTDLAEGKSLRDALNIEMGKAILDEGKFATVEEYSKEIERVEGQLNSLLNTDAKMSAEEHKQAYMKAESNRKVLEKYLAGLRYAQFETSMKEQASAIENLVGSDETTEDITKPIRNLTDEEKKAIAKAAKELATAQKDMWIKVNDAAIAAMEEGTEKKLAAIENERLQALDALDKERSQLEELAQKGGTRLSDDTYSQLEQRRRDTEAAAARERAAVEEEQAKYIAGLYQELADVFSSEERRKIDAIHRTYEEQRSQLAKDLAGGTITQAQHQELSYKIDEAEKRQIERSWIETFGNYEQKLEALKQEWADKIKGVPAEFAEEANKQMDAAISDFIINNSEAKSAVTRLFDDMTEKAVSDLRKIAAEGQELYDFLSSGTWDSSIGESLNITQEQFNTLRRSPEELAKIRKAIKDITDQADANDTIFKTFAAGLKEMFSAGDNSTKLQKGLDKVTMAVTKATAATGFLNDAFQKLSDATGNEAMQSIADGLNIATEAMGSAMQGAQAGAAFGPWGAAAGAAIGMVTSLYQNIAKLHDANIQQKIEDLQKQIDSLGDSYNRLGKLADDAFGKNKLTYINQQNDALRKQNQLIREQISEEESKKKSDTSKIDEWNAKLKENQETIEDNKKAAIDAIFGEDIQSAISNFSDAQADAWLAGEKGSANAKEQVKKMMQQMVTESIKAYIQAKGSMDRIRSAMQSAMADDIITDEERRRIEEMADQLASDIEAKYGWANDLFSPEKERAGLKGTGIAATQDSVDTLDARMTTMQEHTFTLVQGQQELIRVSNAILDKVAGIEEHTAGSERELGEVRRSMSSIKNTMDDISLKGVKIRS